MSGIHESWGYASHDMYVRRWQLIRPHITLSAFVLVDWGSDAGWFSVNAAHSFPDATVLSVESGLMSDGEGLRLHKAKIAQYAVDNNVIVPASFGPDTFRGLREVRSDYQLVLSVFHHIGDGFGRYLRTEKDWDDAFAGLIMGSRTTFFEIPNETSPAETPHRIRAWYGDRDVDSVIRSALDRTGLTATVELLGETEHGAKGRRKLFKIEHSDPVVTADAREIADYIGSASRSAQMRPLRRLRFVLARVRHRLLP